MTPAPDVKEPSTFTSFAKLPAEIRAMIWECCLPWRVSELNKADPYTIWPEYCESELFDPDRPCLLNWSTKANKAPPLITQVCREARKIALASRTKSDPSASEYWSRPNIDYLRDSPHIYNPGVGDSIHGLLKSAIGIEWARSPGRSFTSGHLEKYPPEGDSTMEDFEGEWEHLPDAGNPARTTLPSRETHPHAYEDSITIIQVEKWRLIVETVVIHGDMATANSCGMFGLLGDAPIQIIDLDDTTTIDMLYSVAQAAEEKAKPNVRQYLRRRTMEQWRKHVRNVLWYHRYPDDIFDRLCLAVMFRFCPWMCNHPGVITSCRSFAPLRGSSWRRSIPSANT